MPNVGDWVFWAVMIALAMYAVMIYNNLVSLNHGLSKAWANIDVLLGQRHDELPKLVEICQQYMPIEQDPLTQVTKARALAHAARRKGDVRAAGLAENQMRMGLGQLFAVAENYPELKANQSFQHLQARVLGLENAIADRRELYNERVNVKNARIAQFPDLIIARLFSFGPAERMEFEAAELCGPDTKSLFA